MSKRKLLLADDSITIQKVVNLTFTDEGFEVHTVGDGDSALAKIAELSPDIVLADVNMPGANGYQVCAALRQSESSKNTPVILLVGSFEPFDEHEAANVGANAYLTKPFQSIRQLVAQVSELLEASPQVSEPEPVQAAESDPERSPYDLGDSFDSEPAAEPAATAAAAPAQAPDDIASLYERSFGEPGSAGQGSGDIADFGEGGLDDEMIETSYLGTSDRSETLDFEIENQPSQADQPEETHAGMEREISGYYGSTDAANETAAAFAAPETQQVSEQEPRFDDGSFGDQSVGSMETQSFESQSIDTGHDFAAEIPQTDVEDDVEQPPPVMMEPEKAPEIPPLTGDAGSFSESPPDGMPSPFESIAVPEQPSQIGIETVSFEQPQSSPSSMFDDIDLLDLPPSGSNQTVELTTAERAELMGSDKRVVSLSPELLEIIVEKVVERMSQKY